ncbi:MAG: LysM peptidoglycan-binding domain-containing protein [Treponema sp.]|nr:LysM peptidoglycan-binding domain-containing protein [Treponema sp.]
MAAPTHQPIAAVIAAHAPLLDLTGAQTHTVAPGDTLVTVAQRFFGGLPNVGDAGVNNGFYFPIIILASGVALADPDLIQPGMVLTVPDLRRNLDNPAARQAIRQSLLQIAEIYRVENRRPAKVQGLTVLADSL